MSVLQRGVCLNILMCQLCGNTICLYINRNYTQPVSEQISNTNQFIQNVQSTGTVWTYPLRVYSEIPMTRIARGQRNDDRSHYLSQQPTGERKRIVSTRVQVCVITMWRATVNFYILSDGYRPPLLQKPPSITVGKYAVEIMSQHFHIWRDKQTIQGSCQKCIWKDKQNQGKSFVLESKTRKPKRI